MNRRTSSIDRWARARERACRLAAPTVLVLIALLQLYRAHAFGQTPWKGGGFGMFASVDGTQCRVIRCTLRVDGRDYRVVPPRSSKPTIDRVRVVPTQRRLDLLAEELAALTWVPYDYYPPGLPVDGLPWPAFRDAADEATPAVRPLPLLRAAEPTEPLPPGFTPFESFEVRIELWRLDYDRDSHVVHGVKALESIAGGRRS